MITVKQLHYYQNLVELGLDEGIKCIEGDLMIPFEKDGEPVFWCVSCGEIKTLGLNNIQHILYVIS